MIFGRDKRRGTKDEGGSRDKEEGEAIRKGQKKKKKKERRRKANRVGIKVLGAMCNRMSARIKEMAESFRDREL